MKKVFLMAFMAMSMVAMAQHVTPVSVRIAEVRLDSLRALYGAEPTMYRASLEVVSQQLAKNADELKAAKAELKVEKAHSKEIDKSLKEAIKMTGSLKKLYAKEESELKSMQKTVEKQQKTLTKQTELNQETRASYQSILDREQKELGYSLTEIADRQRTVSELETTLQNKQTQQQRYVQEIEQKTAQLQQLEALHKERTGIIKAEQKSAKSMQ